MTDPLDAAIELLLSGLPDSETAGPEGTGYRWMWDEATFDEQGWVKNIREQVAELRRLSAASRPAQTWQPIVQKIRDLAYWHAGDDVSSLRTRLATIGIAAKDLLELSAPPGPVAQEKE